MFPQYQGKKFNPIKIFLFFIILALAFLAAGGWYMYSLAYSTTLSLKDLLTESQTALTLATSEKWTLPENYNGIVSAECGVRFLMPTRDVVVNPTGMDAASEWRFSSQRVTGVDAFSQAQMVNTQNVYWMRTDGLGSGYVPGSVSISCGDNTKGYTVDTLFDAIKADTERLNDMNQGNGTGAVKFEVKKVDSFKKWGQDVIAYNILGGYDETLKIYIVATPEHIYNITTVAHSENETIKTAVTTMFDNIEFIQK
jgi:hypothetical protein